MMVLVIGGSGSGKSSYAESAAVLLSWETGLEKYYLATMQTLDKEGQERAARHRRLRSGKGFLTIEQPVDIQKALDKMKAGKGIVLLECISNLAANEMFTGEKIGAEEQIAEKIISGIMEIKEKMPHVIVVSNNVFEDGITYSEGTMKYIRAMGRVNQRLAAMADWAVEIVAGIPVVVSSGQGALPPADEY